MTFLTEGTTATGEVEHETPDRVFRPWHELFEFTLDGAASHLNAKVDRYCTAEGTFYRDDGKVHQLHHADGLTFPWANERVWLNPPWGEGLDPCVQPHSNCKRKVCERREYHIDEREVGAPDFLRKVRDEHLREGAIVVALLPARPDTVWFHDYVLPYARTIRWLRGRVKFLDPETKREQPQPPVGSFIAVFR